MAWVGLRLVVVFLASLVAVVLCADNATTAAPATTTPAPATTTPKPRTPGVSTYGRPAGNPKDELLPNPNSQIQSGALYKSDFVTS